MNCKLVTYFHPDLSPVFWRISLRNTHVDEMPRRRRARPFSTARCRALELSQSDFSEQSPESRVVLEAVEHRLRVVLGERAAVVIRRPLQPFERLVQLTERAANDSDPGGRDILRARPGL